MKRIVQLFLCVVCLAISTQAYGQGAVRGTVRDASNGETLPNANVVIDSLHIGVATDKAGYFVIGNLSSGLHRVSASYIGYESRSVQVVVIRGETARIVIELEPAELMGEEIEAIGERVAPTEVTPVSAFGTRVTELARIPTVGQPDLMRGIQLLPGVQAASENSAGLYVRGGTPGQNLILLDDVVVYNPNHLFGFFSTFNPDALKDVTLIKGTFPARYGDRLSSVLDITNLDGNRKSFDARASMDLISAGLTVGGPVGDRGSWMFSGRRTYQEVLNSPLFDHIVDEMFSTRIGTIGAGPVTGGGPGGFGGGGFGGRQGGGRFGQARFNFQQQTSDFGQDYGFYDTNFKLNLDVSDNDRVSVSGYMGNDALNLSLPSFREQTRDQLMDWGNRIARFKWLHIYTDNLIGNVQVSASRYLSNFDVATNQNEAANSDQAGQGGGGRRGFALNRNNELNDLTAKLTFDLYSGPFHTTRVGAQFTSYDAFYKQGVGDSTRSQINTSSFYQTGFLEHTMRWGRLELTPGLRVSHFQSGNYTRWSPRVAGLFQLDDRIAFKGGWGIYHQFVNLISIEANTYTTDMWLPVDETLTPGKAVHNAFGLMLTPGESWQVDLEFYHKDMDDLVEFQSQVRLSDSTPLSDLFATGSGRSYGGEFLLRKTEGRLKGWIGYTLSKTEHTFAALNQGNPFPPKYDRRHDVSVVTDYYLGRGWNLNANWVYGTGQAYTLPEARYEVQQPTGQSIPYVHVSEKNAYRLPAYHRMDLGITRDFRWGGVGGQLVFSVFNVYNRRNVWYRSFDATEPEIQVQDVLLQPILPSVGFRFNM